MGGEFSPQGPEATGPLFFTAVFSAWTNLSYHLKIDLYNFSESIVEHVLDLHEIGKLVINLDLPAFDQN